MKRSRRARVAKIRHRDTCARRLSVSLISRVVRSRRHVLGGLALVGPELPRCAAHHLPAPPARCGLVTGDAVESGGEDGSGRRPRRLRRRGRDEGCSTRARALFWRLQDHGAIFHPWSPTAPLPGPGTRPLTSPPLPPRRPRAQEREDPLPRPRQRGEDDAAAHAQGEPRADPPADAAPEPGRADHRQHPVQDLRPRRPRDGAAALEGLLHDRRRRRVHGGRARQGALLRGEAGARLPADLRRARVGAVPRRAENVATPSR